MTDEALAGGAPAPAENNAAPISAEAPTQTSPLGSQTPVAPKPEAPAKEDVSKSAGDAIKRAQEALKAKEAAKTEPKTEAKVADKAAPEKADAKPEAAKAERTRAEDGKFAPKEGDKPAQEATSAQQAAPKSEAAPQAKTPHSEAPSRFSADAKTAWETAPEPVKAEVHRAIRELEQGHQKYKESAERYDLVREYDELARKNGREGVHESLKQVVELEKAFERNPIEGFQKVADHFGISLRAVAQHIMGQKPEQVEAQRDSTISNLKSEIAQLKQQLGGVTKTIETQRQTETLTKVQQFAKDHPRFDELSTDIEFFLKSGRTNDLSEAYELAERLNPAPATASTSPVDPAPAQPAPLNPAGQKSISGAPSAGSNPVTRKAPASSTREALERAFKRAG